MKSISHDLSFGALILLFLYFFAMLICAQLFWKSRSVRGEGETWWMNRSVAPFYLASLLLIVLYYVLWFSVHVYPLIPFSVGGGKPLTVAFIEGEKKMPDEIQKADQFAKRSVPYKLILATDKSFVVVAPSDKALSVEINRDSVAGIVVLSSK
jgi:H+/Cl- antiporter ClcA